jgi:hypothetical protein
MVTSLTGCPVFWEHTTKPSIQSIEGFGDGRHQERGSLPCGGYFVRVLGLPSCTHVDSTKEPW